MSGPWAELVIWEDEASLLVLWKAEGEIRGGEVLTKGDVSWRRCRRIGERGGDLAVGMAMGWWRFAGRWLWMWAFQQEESERPLLEAETYGKATTWRLAWQD